MIIKDPAAKRVNLATRHVVPPHPLRSQGETSDSVK